MKAGKTEMRTKIKVLIIDDSAVVRQTLKKILSSDRRINVMATAPDPIIAEEKIRLQRPDVITLDIQMPRMDGLTYLKKLMKEDPIPVVICSSHTVKGSDTALRALELGAVEIIHKPRLGPTQVLEESRRQICDAVKAASLARLKPAPRVRTFKPKHSADVIIHRKKSSAAIESTEKIVVLGASTGGTEAIRIFLNALPTNTPGIVIVQHMPEEFTGAFANRLDELCPVKVKEAKNLDPIIPGRALIAPGNRHILIKRSNNGYFVNVTDGPQVNHHRPSVDVLFRSASRYAGANVIGIIMTGMGSDGAQGMTEIKETGGYTIAQDEASCVIFGMPRAAVKKGCVDKILALDEIAKEVIALCS
jgi:two-component system chemotaxis response regulator CheB